MTAVRIAIPEELNVQLIELQEKEYPFLNLAEMFKLGISKLYTEYNQKKIESAEKIKYDLSILPILEHLSEERESRIHKSKKTKLIKVPVVNENILHEIL